MNAHRVSFDTKITLGSLLLISAMSKKIDNHVADALSRVPDKTHK